MLLDFSILDLRTRHAFSIARLAAPASRRSLWVRLRDEEGREGWGEAAANPYYGETAETVVAVLERLRPVVERIEGEGVFELERIEAEIAVTIGRNPAARAAISAALHDLVGKRLGVPVWRLLGLDPAAAPRSSFTIGIDEPEVMREKVREAAGFPVLKIKVGTPRDEEVLRLIRDEAPEKVVRVDANTGWTTKQAIAALPMLADYGVELIEQPLPARDLDGLRLVRERSPVPIIADESCVTLADVPRMAGVVDGINIKLAKCGSLREALRMVHCARAHDLRVMLGCMVESTLGIAAALQLAPLVDYVDLDGAALLADDPFRGPGLLPDGALRFNGAPGLGVEAASGEIP
ncbi:MAG TPA: dipeptide epimerase [Longimicrobiaceae bacterium]|nr:dipeptide epimerase [Longimicrobiaceae bacterium]